MERVELDQLLASRDQRWALERKLLSEGNGCVLIVLTVIMPGAVKRDARSQIIANAAVEAIANEFQIHPMLKRDLVTGYEAYWLVGGDELSVKKRTCNIEETHFLGRLFDIDVIASKGTPVSRQSVGLEPRRCLICDREARFCMRNHTHTQEDLQNKINEILRLYSSKWHEK